jgi:hypothetical protein
LPALWIQTDCDPLAYAAPAEDQLLRHLFLRLLTGPIPLTHREIGVSVPIPSAVGTSVPRLEEL